VSHTTTLKGMKIKDDKAMRDAVDALKQQGINCELLTNVKPRMYYNNQEAACAYVLRLHDGNYDVGFRFDEATGEYHAVLDTWSGYVAQQIGANPTTCPMPTTTEGRTQHAMGRFLQEYGLHAAINAATEDGMIVNGYSKDEKGNYQLELASLA
jgi:pyridoxine 5'-phosphate synthase PdxJ